jgi:predicted DsbA family dithiol-disulfide isomerase
VAAAIFRGQRQMFTASNPLAALRRIAASVGFDAQEFNACVTDETYRSQVEAAMQAANEDEVNSTPTFIINGERFVGLRNTEQMRAILDRKLAEAQNRGGGDGEDDPADTGDGTQ